MNRSLLLAATFLLTVVTSTVDTASGAFPLVLDGSFGSVVLVEAVAIVVFLAVLGGGCLVGARASDPSDGYLSLALPAFGAGAAGAALGTVLGFLVYSAVIPQFGAFVATPFGVAGGPFGGIPFVSVLVPTVGAALMRGTVVALAVVAGAAIAHDDSPGATPLGEFL